MSPPEGPNQGLRAIKLWFKSKGWEPFNFQFEAWTAFLDRRSGLIHAPTGIGKTYAAWFGPVLEFLNSGAHLSGGGQNHSAPPLTVLWVTPLRALANDIQAALVATISELNLPWSLEIRTGDTLQSVKNRQKKRLPTVLITTPESLNLLLSYPGAC